MRHSHSASTSQTSRCVDSEASRSAANTAGTSLPNIPRFRANSVRRAEQSLATADSCGHDSPTVHVTDDWPPSVPITSEEVDVIEAFLRREINELLR